MLKIDINRLPEEDVKRIVGEPCGRHGDVLICEPTLLVDYNFAFVRTADPSGVARLVNAFEAICVNEAAVIRLDTIGRVDLPGKKRHSSCNQVPRNTFRISLQFDRQVRRYRVKVVSTATS